METTASDFPPTPVIVSNPMDGDPNTIVNNEVNTNTAAITDSNVSEIIPEKILIVILLDRSGSMRDVKNKVQECVVKIASKHKELDPSIYGDPILVLIPFADNDVCDVSRFIFETLEVNPINVIG